MAAVRLFGALGFYFHMVGLTHIARRWSNLVAGIPVPAAPSIRWVGHLIGDGRDRTHPRRASIASLATMKIIDGESGRLSACGRCRDKALTT